MKDIQSTTNFSDSKLNLSAAVKSILLTLFLGFAQLRSCAATVKNIIRQNKKAALQEFLFKTAEVNQDQTVDSIPYLEDQIEALKNQVNFLQQKIIETFEENPKYTLSRTLKASDATKIIQQGLTQNNS